MKIKRNLQCVLILNLILILVASNFLVTTGTLAVSTSKPDSFIVQGEDIDEVILAVNRHGGTITSRLEIISGVGADLTTEAIARLLAEPGISAITPNNTVHLADDNVDNDIDTLCRSGRFIPATNYPDVVGADVVWDQGATGEGISVAVVDTGLNRQAGLVRDIHGNRGRIIGWVDFVRGKNKPVDKNGHGSHIAGIIANTQIGEDGEWNGVAPGVDLVGVRVLDKRGAGTYEWVIQGIQWVVDHKDEFNIRVINLSLVSSVLSPYWADPFNQAVMRAWAEGIVVIAAAGNGGPDAMTIGVPGNTPYIVTVGAFTDNYTPYDWSDDYIAPFSAAGPTLDGFVKPDIVAPGAHIVSLMKHRDYLARLHPEAYVARNYYSIAGTSQSAAVVSGVAALILTQNPDLTPDEVKYRLMYSSALWMELDGNEPLYSIWQQGAGRVNAPGAVLDEYSGVANEGMDIWGDIAGDVHYEGYTTYDSTTGLFHLLGEYNTWNGNYGTWSGGYGTWSGGYGTWSGSYGTWSGGYGTWSGSYGTWSGGYGTWSGSYGTWSGSYGTWSGGYGTWSGSYGTWSGSEPWAGTIYADPVFVENYLAGVSPDLTTSTTFIGNWVTE
jgi:serine protease AprX